MKVDLTQEEQEMFALFWEVTAKVAVWTTKNPEKAKLYIKEMEAKTLGKNQCLCPKPLIFNNDMLQNGDKVLKATCDICGFFISKRVKAKAR